MLKKKTSAEKYGKIHKKLGIAQILSLAKAGLGEEGIISSSPVSCVSSGPQKACSSLPHARSTARYLQRHRDNIDLAVAKYNAQCNSNYICKPGTSMLKSLEAADSICCTRPDLYL